MRAFRRAQASHRDRKRRTAHPRARLALALLGALVGCDAPGPPPGPSVDSERSNDSLLRSADGGPRPDAGLEPPSADAGSDPASSPPRIASIAMRNWVYAEPSDHATRLGYLRAGAIVERDPEPAGTAGCAGGWYAIRPRGYVCVGRGASLDLDHPVALAGLRAPRRGQPFPYPYVVAGKPPPNLYFRLPTEQEQRHVEGKSFVTSRVPLRPETLELLGAPDEVPPFLAAGGKLTKPYGAKTSLHFGAHRGRAALDSAFGLVTTFEWTGRRFGLTTELDLLPVDRTRVARPSALRGAVVEGEGTPALVVQHGVESYRPGAGGKLQRHGRVPFRSGWVLTGEKSVSPPGLVEATTGDWLPVTGLKTPKLREDPAGFAAQGRRWIDISIRDQVLVAYEGRRPVFLTLVSTGRGGMGDPEKSQSTVRGTFMVHSKHLTATMDGDEASDETYELRDVPYVQYFHEGFALHGAFWHDEFGRPRSHGCVNLSPADAAWLFEWTYPAVPESWHGAENLKSGTLVYIHG